MKDVFRLTSGVPSELAGASDAEKTTYLERNKAAIDKMEPTDELWIDGVKSDGNQVSSALGPVIWWDGHSDYTLTYSALTGTSNFGTRYPVPTFINTTGDRGTYNYQSERLRDVNVVRADETGVALITYMDRAVVGIPPNLFSVGWVAGHYALADLAPADRMLTIVLGSFADGDGGLRFQRDPLSNYDANIYFHRYDDTVSVGYYRDIDDVVDGYMAAGGSFIDSDHAYYNGGVRPYEGQGVDWAAFVAPPVNWSGTTEADTYAGTYHNDVLDGGDGDDILRGLPGNDVLRGGAGADTIHASDGRQMNGGSANDQIDGGGGFDRVVYAGASAEYEVQSGLAGSVVVTHRWGPDGTDTLIDVEQLLFEADGALVDLTVNMITGSASGDVLAGTAGRDEISGLEGNDVLIGGRGSDLLDGGSGNDTYHYAAGDGSDRIVDESATSGTDNDVIEFADLFSSDILVRRGGGDGSDLLVEIVTTGEVITVHGQFAASFTGAQAGPEVEEAGYAPPGDGIEGIRFADAGFWSRGQIEEAANGGLYPAHAPPSEEVPASYLLHEWRCAPAEVAQYQIV